MMGSQRDRGFATSQKLPQGITFPEVLICLGVLTILAGLAAPALLRMRERARRQTCQQRLRTLTQALASYHDTHTCYPPAAVWNAESSVAAALHLSQRIERITHDNWALKLLAFLPEPRMQYDNFHQPIGADVNEPVRTTWLAEMSCPTDHYNRWSNPYRISHAGRSVEFARGNYAINGGSHNHDLTPPSTARPAGDFAHLLMEDRPRRFQLWGNGIAGINKSFSRSDFSNGASSLVAIEEVRAGIHPLDPRGVWSLGQIGGSITWAHGINSDDYGPNNQHARADDILGCQALHDELGSQFLQREHMPCVSYIDINQQATARSLHPGGVFAGFLDGSVRFVSDHIDPGLWHVLHSRETPRDVIPVDFVDQLREEHRQHERNHAAPADAVSNSGSTKLPARFQNSLEMEFVTIPAGSFMMGRPDVGRDAPDEAPEHAVTLSNAYALSTCEVTAQLYAQVMTDRDENIAIVQQLDGQQPARNISWDDAVVFCERLSALPAERAAGREYRLPTEAEWEFACREGADQAYDNPGSRRDDDTSGEAAGIMPALDIHPVKSFPPNDLGLYDMRGNVWEWTADWFDRDYYARSPTRNPTGPSKGYLKVVRGGDWRFVGEPCLIDYAMLPPWKRHPLVGFRVICE